MIRWILKRQLDEMERELGVPVDETRYMLEHSVKALVACSGLKRISEFHGTLPSDVYYTAKIAAYRQADCGSCLQISVNLAAKNGVPGALIRDLAAGRTHALPEALRDVYTFAEKQANRIDDPELRERLRKRYGDSGLIALGVAIMSAQTFPTLKRALGYALSCSQIEIPA
jgi:hypothetical protein